MGRTIESDAVPWLALRLPAPRRARILGPLTVLIGALGAVSAAWLLPGLPGARVVLAGHPELSWTVVPVVFGVVHALAVAVGEAMLPRSRGPIRSAQLRRRSSGEYVAPWARWTAVAGTVLTITTLIASVWIARSLHGSWHDWFAVRLESNEMVRVGPWALLGGVPGLPLVGPALAGVLAVCCADAVALRGVAARGSVGSDHELDDRMRRASAMRIVTSGVASVLSVEAAFAFLGGVTVVGVSGRGTPVWVGWLGVAVGFALALGAAGLLLASVAVGSRRR